MAMFDKKDSSSAPPPSGGSGLNALLGEGSVFEGKLHFEGSVRIDGRFNGEIHSEGRLLIGEKAQVNATVAVGAAEISGRLVGNLAAKNRIDIRSKGHVEGDITAPICTIEEGGTLDGQCRMGKGAENVKPIESAKAKREEREESAEA